MPDATEIRALVHGLAELFSDPAERIFWPFLLGAVVLVFLALGFRRGWAELRSGLLDRGLWFHPSTRVDVGLFVVKLGLGASIRLSWLGATVSLTLWLALALHEHLGPAPSLAWSTTGIAVVYTLVLFVAWDYSRYLLHRWMHTVSWLWPIHAVHHSAEVLTPITLYRSHPIETLFYDLRGVLTTALVTGAFLYLFRGDAIELELLGINAIGFVFNLAGANLRHSQVWLRFGWLERYVLSPAQHQVHHARDPQLHGHNLGTWLAVWDRMAGTWLAAPPERVTAFGLEHADHRARGLLSTLVDPLRTLANGARRGRLASSIPLLAVLAIPSTARGSEPPQADTTDPRDPVPQPEVSAVPSPPRQPSPTKARQAVTDEPGDGDEVDFELPETAPSTQPTKPAPSAPTTTGDYDVAVEPISIIGTPEARAHVAGSAHVIGREELERKEYDDIHRVLQTVPGVYVREEDGYGLRPNIGLRGASSDRSSKVTLMEDGVLMAPAPYSASAAYYFPMTTRVVGVEVFKGPASIRHGPNTIGGAINVQTRNIPTRNAGFIDVAAGMRNYGKLHGWWGTTYKRFGVLLEGGHIQTSGFKKLDGGGNTGFDKNELMLKARYAVDPNRRVYHQFDVKGGFSNEISHETYLGLTDQDFASTPYRRYAASQNDRMRWWRTQAQATYLVARGTLFDLQVQAYRHDFQRAWRKFNDMRGMPIGNVLAAPDSGQTAIFYRVLSGAADSSDPQQAVLIGTNDRRFVSQGLSAVAHVRPTWRWLQQDIEIGARLHHDEIKRLHTEDAFDTVDGQLISDGTATATNVHNRAYTVAGAFHLIDDIRIKRVSLTPGARVEVIGNRLDDRLTNTHPTHLSTVFIPGGGVHVFALPWLGVFAGVHSGFSPVAPGQPSEVRPERSVNYELGARADHRSRRTRTRAELVGFLNDYSNLTAECTFSTGCDDSLINRQFNAGRVYVYGLEAAASERFEGKKGWWFEAGGSYTLTLSRFRTSFTSANPQLADVSVGDSLPYVPVHLAALTAAFGGRIWGVHATGTYVGDMRDVAGQGTIPDQQRIPRHGIVDLSSRVSITKRASLYLTINNLLNNAYMVSRRPFGARPGMPLQLMAGFKYDFS